MNTAARKEKRPRAHRRRAGDEAASQQPLPTNTTKFWFCAIFACAFVLRLIYLVQVEAIPLFYHLAGDGWTYDDWARRIAAGDWLGDGVFYQAPLYPYFLGVLHFLFGHSLWLVRIVQIGLGSLACAVTFIVGERLFSRPEGIVAGLILACYAPAIFFDGLIEKSVLDLSLLTALLFVLYRADSLSEGGWRWSSAGVLLGLLGLSRENALALVAVIALWIGLYFSKRSLTLRARWLGWFFAGVLLVLVPVGLRNLAVGGEFKLTTAQLGANFFIGNNPGADGTYGSIRKVIGETQLEGSDAERLAERALGRDLTSGQVSDYWLHQGLEYIKSRPVEWLRLLGMKWLLVWHAREIEDSDDFYIYQSYSSLLALLGWFSHFGVLAPLAALGVYSTRRRWREFWLLYLMVVALALSVALFYVFGRYRFPLVPLLTLFAGAAVIEIGRVYKERAWGAAAPGVVVFLLAAMLVNWPWRGAAGPGPEGYNNLSNAYYKQGQVNEAIDLAQKALTLAPDYGVAHYNIGNLYAAQSRFELAERHFEEALRLYPNSAEAHSNYGQLLAQRGDLERSIRYFERAVALNPTLGRAQLNLGLALAKQGRIAEAARPLEESARLMPDSAEASYYLGSVYAAENRYGDAAQSFRQALRMRPDFAPAHESLAQLLALQGKTAEARLHYQEAIRLLKQQRSSGSTR